MTIGDILAVIGIILLLGASWMATVLLVALAFPARARAAQQRIVVAPGRSLATGAAIAVVVGVLANILNHSHAGPVRIGAGALLTGLGVLTMIGSTGIVRI